MAFEARRLKQLAAARARGDTREATRLADTFLASDGSIPPKTVKVVDSFTQRYPDVGKSAGVGIAIRSSLRRNFGHPSTR